MLPSLFPDFYRFIDLENETQTSCRATLALNPRHPIFAGHFPGLPVVPGVCMIQMTKELLERSIGRETRLKAAQNIKFMTVLDPNDHATVLLSLSWQAGDDGSLAIDSVLKTLDGARIFFKMKGTFV